MSCVLGPPTCLPCASLACRPCHCTILTCSLKYLVAMVWDADTDAPSTLSTPHPPVPSPAPLLDGNSLTHIALSCIWRVLEALSKGYIPLTGLCRLLAQQGLVERLFLVLREVSEDGCATRRGHGAALQGRSKQCFTKLVVYIKPCCWFLTCAPLLSFAVCSHPPASGHSAARTSHRPARVRRHRFCRCSFYRSQRPAPACSSSCAGKDSSSGNRQSGRGGGREWTRDRGGRRLKRIRICRCFP